MRNFNSRPCKYGGPNGVYDAGKAKPPLRIVIATSKAETQGALKKRTGFMTRPFVIFESISCGRKIFVPGSWQEFPELFQS